MIALSALLWIASCNRCPTTAATIPEPQLQKSLPPAAISGATKSAHTSASPALPISLSISGLVRQPLNLGLSDLQRFQSVTARLNDVHRDGGFFGVHIYRGVPLRELLEMADVAKEESVFDRPIDLSIVLRNRDGAEVTLSYGEVFYSNPAEMLIAYEAVPKMPHKSCGDCHEPAVYQKRLDEQLRQVALPKLIATSDLWSDRCIEGITSIEVRDLGRGIGIFLPKADKPKKLSSENVQIQLPNAQPFVVKDLAGYGRFSADVVQAGDGIGFHGIRRYEGVPLSDVLLRSGVKPDPALMFICSAPDGYRISLSAGELFYSAFGVGVMLADKLDGKPIDDGGRFRIVPTRDQAADRWLKSAARIDIVRAERPAFR